MEGFLEGAVLALTLQATAMIVPGQNHFLILSVSRTGLFKAMLAVAGIASGGAVYSSGASAAAFLSGKAADFRVFALLGLVGCLYLLHIGIGGVRRGLHPSAERRTEAPRIAWTAGRAFLSGFLVNLSNAKSILFFGSIFTTALPLAEMSIPLHILAVSMFFLNSILVHGGVAMLLSSPVPRKIIEARQNAISLASGAAFIVFSISSMAGIFFKLQENF